MTSQWERGNSLPEKTIMEQSCALFGLREKIAFLDLILAGGPFDFCELEFFHATNEENDRRDYTTRISLSLHPEDVNDLGPVIKAVRVRLFFEAEQSEKVLRESVNNLGRNK